MHHFFSHTAKEGNMNVLTSTVARILYAVPFFFFGLNHFMNASMMKGYVPSFFPVPIFWVYLVGLGLIAASVSILTKKYTRLACLLLAGMLIVFVLTIHIPGMMSADATMKMNAMVMLLKDTALAGAALMLAGQSES